MSYAVNPANTPSTTQFRTMSKVVYPRNKFTTVNIKATTKAAINTIPKLLKSLSVLYPINANIPKKADVANKAYAIVDNSNAANITENVTPC